MRLRLCLAILVVWLGPNAAKASDISYSLPPGSFTFAPGSASHYLSPHLRLIGNNGTQYSQKIKENGYYSITISAALELEPCVGPGTDCSFCRRFAARARPRPGERQRLRLERQQ